MKTKKFQKTRIIFYFAIFFINSFIYSQDGKNCKYILNTYYDVLKSENRDTLIEQLPKVKDLYYYSDEHSEHFYEKTWIDYYDRVFEIQLINNAFDITGFYADKNKKGIFVGDFSGCCFVIDSMKINKNEVIFSVYSNDEIDDNRIIIDFPMIKKNANYELKFILDGDYFDLFINNIFVHSFCRINDITLKEYGKLIQNNICDLTKVNWPRHADGTSIYDDKIIVPEPIELFENGRKVTEIKSEESKENEKQILKNFTYNQIVVPRTISVKKNKEMVVTEDSILRLDPYATGAYMTSVSKGSVVKIKKVGKKETIDGVTSNWVLINFIGDAFDTKGKKIYYKMEGWLFGGVLQ